jgi:hypothetical protein
MRRPCAGSPSPLRDARTAFIQGADLAAFAEVRAVEEIIKRRISDLADGAAKVDVQTAAVLVPRLTVYIRV